MATFSFNGTAKQLFLAKALGTVSSTSASGTIDAIAGESGTIYFNYKSPGGVLRSDIIKVANINYAKAVKSASLARGLQKIELTLNSAVNGGSPVAGQDYLTQFKFYEYGSLSYQDQYVKHAAVRVTTGMTADTFYRKTIESCVLNFSRETVELLSFKLKGTSCGLTVIANPAYSFKLDVGASDTTAAIANNVVSLASEVVAGANLSTQNITDLNAALATAGIDAIVLSGTAPAADVTSATAITGTAVVIEEVEQPYVKGLKSSDPVRFDVIPRTITVSGDEVIWGTVTKVTPTKFVNNGKVVADLEYFYAGEKGDQYRNVGFPKVLPTEYLADSAKPYSFIEINYSDSFGGVDVQKSEKAIVIPVLSTADDLTLVNSIIGDINTAAGKTLIATLS